MSERPDWLASDQDVPAPGPARPGGAIQGPRFDDREAYADWYAWAFRQWPEQHRAHAAAVTAWAWMRAGQDRDSASAAAKQAALAGSSGAVPMAGSVVCQYAEWYVWGLRHLKLNPRRAYAAADAAQQALALGASQQEAAITAERAAAATK